MFFVIAFGLTILAVACYFYFVVDSKEQDRAAAEAPIGDHHRRLQRSRDLREG